MDKFILNFASLSTGVMILRTIMELSPPGAVPSPKMLCQIFRLDSPILCRAIVLLEIIRYIRRYTVSWPKWMTEVPLGQNRYDESNYLKDFLFVKLSAGRCFYLWAESLAAELEALARADLSSEHEERHPRITVLNYLQDENVAMSNMSSRTLRMLGIVLLNDLTNHIKEHHHGAKSKIKKGLAHSEYHGTFLPLPKNNKKTKNSPSQSSSPRMNLHDNGFSAESGFFDEGLLSQRTPFSRDSETNRSKGRLEFITQAVGVTAMRSIFGRWTNKDKEANELHFMRSQDIFANPAHEEETRRKATSFRTQHNSKVESAENRFSRNLHWIGNIGNFICEDDFDCDHENGCRFFCYEHLKKSSSALLNAFKIIAVNSNLKDFEASLNIDEPFESSSNSEEELFEDLFEKLHSAPLQMLVDNIQEISEHCLRVSVNNCWNLLTSQSSKISRNAAVVILLACQKFKDTIPLFLNAKIEDNKIENLLAFRVLWNTRNSIWHLVDRRVARSYKLPSLAVNISLPNPPIGECIPDVPDAPWIPYTPDVEILWAEEFNTQKNLIGDELQSRKKEQMKKVMETDQNHRNQARRQFYLSSLSVVHSVTQQYFKLNDHVDEYDESLRRFSSRLMSMSSGGTQIDDHTDESGCELDTPERSPFRLDSWRNETPGQVFPTPLQNLVPIWLNATSEFGISSNNIPVSVFALKTVQKCLNEDSLLFLRNLTEKVYTKNMCPTESVIMLTKLFAFFEQSSAWEMHHQSKKIIANYLIGLIMTLMRSSDKHQGLRINQMMPILDGILPSIHGITLKQIKTTLRKEQCDTTILVSSSITGTKKITCFGMFQKLLYPP